jgi:hypothetical protein
MTTELPYRERLLMRAYMKLVVLRSSAFSVVQNWEKGDLAGAVNMLEHDMDFDIGLLPEIEQEMSNHD